VGRGQYKGCTATREGRHVEGERASKAVRDLRKSEKGGGGGGCAMTVGGSNHGEENQMAKESTFL